MILLPLYRLWPLYVRSMFQSQEAGEQGLGAPAPGPEVWLGPGLGGLIRARCLQPIGPRFRLIEHVAQERVAAGAPTVIGQQILLGHIGDIGRLGVFGQQVIEGLFPVRPQLGRDGLQPFIGIGENRVDIEDHAPERVDTVLDDVADVEAGGAGTHG